MRAIAALPVAVGLIMAAPGWCVDFDVDAVKLAIRSRGSANSLVFVARNGGALGTAVFDALAAESEGGPVATVEFITNTDTLTLALPAGSGPAGWLTGRGTGESVRFRNPLSPDGPGPIRTFSIRRNHTLRIVARDVPLTFGPPPRTLGVRITVGSTRGCAYFDESTVLHDRPGVAFLARRGGVALTDCSDESLNQAPICGNGVLDPGEQCDGHDVEPVASCQGDAGLVRFQCLSDCTCCASPQSACAVNGDIFAPCCPGYQCVLTPSPNLIGYCHPILGTCVTDEDCPEGRVCSIFGECWRPMCSDEVPCPSGFLGCDRGLCCGFDPLTGEPTCVGLY
jgi:hypothetical protein